MRPRKPHAKSEIGRRPDSRIEVGVLGLTDIVNNLAAGKKVPRMRFSVLFIGISPMGEKLHKPKHNPLDNIGQTFPSLDHVILRALQLFL